MIVTNFNYGHFLKACLDSVASQLHRADEIIIVDDGSDDRSRAILAARDDVVVVPQVNLGQAAAFNAGFAASSGDVLLFLDADDVLAPHALDVVARCWGDGVAGLSYDLSTIDIDGRPSGHYQMRGGSGNQRAQLLRELAVEFMPTSGNAFARAALAWAFPLPEADWRISADALLVRVALLRGPIRHLPQTLGSYRVHGHNNYFAEGLSPFRQKQRGNADIARAGADLVALLDRAGPPPDHAATRVLLLRAALRRRMISDEYGDDLGTMAAFLRRLFRLNRMSDGIGIKLLFGLAPVVVPRSRRLRGWVIERAARPLWLHGLLARLEPRRLRQACARTLVNASGLLVARSPWRFAERDLQRLCAGPEWHWQPDRPVALCQRKGVFILQRFLTGPVYLDLDLEPPAGGGQRIVELSCGGTLLERFVLAQRQTCRVILPQPGLIGASPDQINIEVRFAQGGLWRWLSGLGRSCERLQVHAVEVSQAPDLATGAVLPVAASVPMSVVSRAILGQRCGVPPDDAGLPIPGQMWMSLAPPPGFPGPASLSLQLGASQVPGWVEAWQCERLVGSAEVGPGSLCLLSFSIERTQEPVEIRASLLFRANDSLVEGNLDIQSLGWVAGPPSHEDRRLLSFGCHISAQTVGGLQPVLGAGWITADDGCPVMFHMCATLQFALTPFAAPIEPVLVVDLEPLVPSPGGFPLVVVFAVNGQQATARSLAGAEQVEIPLCAFLDRATNAVEVELYAGIRALGGDAASLTAHGGIRLLSLGLQPILPGLPTRAQPETARPSDVALRQMIAEIDAELANTVDRQSLSRLRTAILAELEGVSAAAILSSLPPAALQSLTQLGACLPAVTCNQDWPRPDQPDFAAAWLRTFAVQAVSGPAFCHGRPLRLADVPACSRAYADVVGRYLAADPRPDHLSESDARYSDMLCAYLQEARQIIASSDATDPQHEVAVAFLENCRPNSLVFAGGPLVGFARAFAAALETFLLMRGEALHMPAADRAPGPVRLAILLRHTDDAPETRITRALLATLPASRFEVSVFVLDMAVPQAVFPANPVVVGLGGLPVSLAVATIRASAPDVAILGSFFFGFSPMSMVAAHRLARCQLAFSAVSPVTTGLSSVDAFVLGDLVAPAGCEQDYSETCLRAPGTGQVFSDMQVRNDESDNPGLLRYRLGLAEDAVVLVSGAMLDKIGLPLLRTWLAILAGSPKAVLVLYPFAPNWNRQFDESSFLRALAELRADFGLHADRIRILSRMTRAEVRRLLRMADLYLDSFPYSGATTTVEALAEGLPTIALQGTTQRGHQAAGWLTAFGVGGLVAADAAAYVDLAVGLIPDHARRAALAARIRENRHGALKQEEFADWLGAFLSRGVPAVPEEPRYLFHHLPKSGGTSLRRILGQWLPQVNDYRAPWSRQAVPPLDLSQLAPGDLLSGHFAADGIPLAKRYPETFDPLRWRKITFLRDPLELALSNYFYERARRPAYDASYEAKPLGQYLRDYPGIYLHHFECSLDSWQAVLGSYWFIGTLERLDDCLAYLARTLGKPAPAKVPRENLTERPEAPDPADVAVFMHNVAHEFEIYRWVSARLGQTLGEQPLDQFPR